MDGKRNPLVASEGVPFLLLGAAIFGFSLKYLDVIFVIAAALLFIVLFLVFRVSLVDVFEPPGSDFTEIRELASDMMIGLTTYMLADATLLIAGGALRGAGDTRWIMVASISVHWLMLIVQ